MAKRSGLTRGYIANLEGSKEVHHPSAQALLKLARAFNIDPNELYLAAGYIDGPIIQRRVETHEEILDRLKRITPQSIPVYSWHYFPISPGVGIEPDEYVYRTRGKVENKNLEAYIVHGDHLSPEINDGDVVIVDRKCAADHGDVVACVIENEVHLVRVHKVAGEIWLEDNHGKFKYVDSDHASPVIESIRRMKLKH